MLLPIGLATVIAGLTSRYGKRLTTVGGILVVIVVNAVLYLCVYATLQLPEMILTLPLTLFVMIPWGYAFTNGAETFMPAVALQTLAMISLSTTLYMIFRKRPKKGEQVG